MSNAHTFIEDFNPFTDDVADPHKVSLGTAALAKAKEQFGITPTP